MTLEAELGDKSFVIAALLAAGAVRLTFAGAIAACTVTTALAVSFGQLFQGVPDGGSLPVDDIFIAGKLLADASQMDDDEPPSSDGAEVAEAAALRAPLSSPIFLQALFLVFAADFGDRSFTSAAGLSAQSTAAGAGAVFVGAVAAHGAALALAVGLGSLIGRIASQKQVAILGGVLFLLFAATSGMRPEGSI